MIIALSIVWLFCSLKAILFWLYLWQLKEYHWGRFRAHFRTLRGRLILLNKTLAIKLFFIIGYLATPLIARISLLIPFDPTLYPIYLSFFLFLFYFFGAAKTVYGFLSGTLIRPVFTKKTIFLFLLASGLFALVPFLFYSLLNRIPAKCSADFAGCFAQTILLIDILSPLIVSLIVLSFQPFTALWRNYVIYQAKKKRASFKKLIAIGITGSYGKTSVKEFLYEILSRRFNVLKTEAHQNAEIGISRCILERLNSQQEIFIAEMGAYNRGGIRLLAGIVQPKIGILTGISEQHLDTFGSQENIIRTKFELIESLPEEGTAILNGNDERIKNQELRIKDYNQRLRNIKICTTNGVGDIWTENIVVEKEKISFWARTKDGDEADFQVNLLGRQNVINLLLAAQCAKELGMSLKEISEAARNISPKQSGITLIKGRDGLNVLDSTYSANPQSVIAHLDYLLLWPGKKAIIMPSLIELGTVSEAVHQKIGRKIAEVCDLAVITTPDGLKAVQAGAAEIKSNFQVIYSEDKEKILKIIKDNLKEDDVVLLESRVPEKIINYLERK